MPIRLINLMFLNKPGIFQIKVVNLQRKRKQMRMKSIKEKSNEYADKQDLRMAYNGSCDNCRQGFVLGANYVLDAIEKSLQEFSNYEDSLIISRIIEQLKK